MSTWRRKLFDAGAAQEADVPEALPAAMFAEAVIGGDAVAASVAEHPAIIIDLPRGERLSILAAALKGLR